MACACMAGNWTTGNVKVQNVETEKINSFLGMTTKYGDNGFYTRPTVTDSGVEKNAEYATLAATAVATINTLAAIEIANKQYDIANDYYKLAQQKWDRFKSTYMPCERKEMAEACNTPEYEKRYDEQASDYMNEVDKNFAMARRRIDDLYARYCICPDPSLAQDMALIQSQIAGDSGNFAYRYEEGRKIAKDDVRWTRRQQALNRGRDLQSNAAQYAKAAADAYGNLGNAVGSAAQGAISAIGYFSNRNDTIYPQRTPIRRPQPSGSMVGAGFQGVTPENGTYGWISSTPFSSGALDPNISGYNNLSTTYTTPNAVTSSVGAQQDASIRG